MNLDLTVFSKVQIRRPAKPLEWYPNMTDSRNNAIVEAYKSGAYSMKEIGDCFGLGYSMVSRIIKIQDVTLILLTRLGQPTLRFGCPKCGRYIF